MQSLTTSSRSRTRTQHTRSESRHKEDFLLRRYAETRSESLRAELLEAFLPLARSLALRYRGGSDMDDLIGVANLGLVKALDRFDPSRGRPFTAFAVPTILGELRRHFRDHVWTVRLPRGLGEMAMAVDDAISRLTKKLGRVPTVAEIAELLDMSEEHVLEALQAADARKTLSLDAPSVRGEDDGAPAVDSVRSVELGYDTVEANMSAAEAGLDEREWKVLRLKFTDGLTQYEIAEILGVSQMQISRVMRRALNKLLVAVQSGNETS